MFDKLKNVFKKIIFSWLIYYEKYGKKNQLKIYDFSNYLISLKKKVNDFKNSFFKSIAIFFFFYSLILLPF